MVNVIVGTAGHVDHGKTCLIKALTGVDTDRLKEEKKRGITIELGFANLPNEEGMHIGIIDVPGHEKFVKNMLAGIGGIDLCLLVIALDEGVMPQTVEHFEIIRNLGIPKGIIVYTKADLMDEEMFELIDEEVTELVRGSFLESAERICVSAYDGRNIDCLKRKILESVRDIAGRRNERELFRLPIDRVFTMEGFGTVVTGTLLEGSCEAGEEVELLPSGKRVRIRQIQSHGEQAQEATAGQRTALNLSGIRKEEIARGEVLAYPDSIALSRYADAAVTLFSSTERKLKSGDRVHFNYGSAQTECRAVLLDVPAIEAGGKALVQFCFDEAVPLRCGDKFIIRFLSPVESFGGGTVLAVNETKHKRLDATAAAHLAVKESGSLEDLIELELSEHGSEMPRADWLAKKVNLTLSEAEKRLQKLATAGKVVNLSESYYIDKPRWLEAIRFSGELLAGFHEENPILPGMPKETFKYQVSRAVGVRDSQNGDILVSALLARKKVAAKEGCIAAPGFAATYSDQNRTMLEDIEKLYREALYEVPSTEEVLERFTDKKLARQIINDLAKSGRLWKIDNNAYLHAENREKLLDILEEWFDSHASITLAEFRDLLGTSRKYALLLLEYFDRLKITKMTGEARVLQKRRQK